MIDILSVLFAALVAGFSTATITSKLDEYMDVNNIFGGVRKFAAAYASWQIGMDWEAVKLDISDTIKKSAFENEAYENPLEVRSALYEQAYNEIAFHHKGFKLLICQACMSEWVNIPVALSIGVWMIGWDWQLLIVLIGGSIVSRWFLD